MERSEVSEGESGAEEDKSYTECQFQQAAHTDIGTRHSLPLSISLSLSVGQAYKQRVESKPNLRCGDCERFRHASLIRLN